jgi:hypothetical protein
MQALANELVGYLAVTDKAFKASLAEHLCRIIQKFSPSVRWYVDMLLKVMLTAGAHVQVRCQYSCSNSCRCFGTEYMVGKFWEFGGFKSTFASQHATWGHIFHA